MNIYEIAEQSAEYSVLNPSEMVLESELGERKVSIPKVFIDKFSEDIARKVFDWVVENVGLMDEQQWQELAEHLGLPKDSE